ncbi:MAG: fumarylacetoacetate hydrolase, partial [Verrucomicrobiales bacterium]|nr:fumarylacetoacetate hydrolase [Verrucomicrobiales bacterium]
MPNQNPRQNGQVIVTCRRFYIQIYQTVLILSDMTRLIQLRHSKSGRRIAIVENDTLRLLKKFRSIYELAAAAIQTNTALETLAAKSVSRDTEDYDAVYRGKTAWKI